MNKLKRAHNHSASTHATVQDCLFLSLVVLLSLVLYVSSLGFYSDDWAFLGWFSMSTDHRISALFHSVYSPQVAMRPLEVLYKVMLYWLFGPHPLGYHLLNAAILVSTILLFYLVLLELGISRIFCLSVPLVYGLLPHYSTNRFWVSGSVVVLSMALYFFSLYSDLRALRAYPVRIYSWKLLSILSLLGSILAYEVVLPLFFLNGLLVWYRGQISHRPTLGKPWTRAGLSFLVGINILMTIPVVVFKVSMATRLGDRSQILQQMVSIARRTISTNYTNNDYGLNLVRAIEVNYGDYGLGLPRAVTMILRDYPNATIFALTGIVGLFIFWYLYRVSSMEKTGLSRKRNMVRLLAMGLLVFGLGYAIFLTNYNVQFTPTGIGNRTAMAAAAGVALSLVGGIGWVSGLLPTERFRSTLFCILVVLLCTIGFLINNTLASFWITAYRQEQVILDDIRGRFPTLPAKSTIILDGICPYIGPAIVFESSWDLAGALMMYYRDNTLRADVVTPNLKIEEDGLSTSLYNAKHHYPYENLFVYHVGQKKAYRLTNGEEARSYFRAFNPQLSAGCPKGHEGLGVPVF